MHLSRKLLCNSEILHALLRIFGNHFLKISSNSEVVMLEAFVELTRNDPAVLAGRPSCRQQWLLWVLQAVGGGDRRPCSCGYQPELNPRLQGASITFTTEPRRLHGLQSWFNNVFLHSSPIQNTHLGSTTIIYNQYLRVNITFKHKSTLITMDYISKTR